MITTYAFLDLVHKEQHIFTFEEMYAQEGMPMAWINLFKSIKWKLELFQANAFSYPYMPWNSEYPTIHPTSSFHLQISTMDASQYLPFTCEYSIWNATVTALQLWTADLEPQILSTNIDQVYTAFFCGDHAQQIWHLLEEILFGCFVTTLNDVFETELAQEDEGYESGSENFNIPTPLSRAPIIYHISMVEDFILQSSKLWSITNYSRAAWRVFTSQTQILQPHTSPLDIHQLQWWEFCRTQWTMQPILWCHRPCPQESRPFNFSALHPVPPHHTHHRPVPHRSLGWWYLIWRTLPNSTIGWWCLAEEPIPDRCLCIHEISHKPNHQCSYPCP